MIDEAYEAEYNIRRRHPESPQHYARYAAESEAARAGLRCELDLAYGEAPGERLDFFPASWPDAPLLLFIHGGYWRALDKKDFSFIAPPFVAAGIAVALINYDLTPKVGVADIVEQARRAVGWTHERAEQFGFDGRRLVVAGHSAGGHLTAMALLAEPPLPIAAGIALSGVFDLVPLLSTNVNEQLRLDAAEARRVSPTHLPPPHRPPALIAVGGDETAGFIAQSQNFAAHCGREARIYPGLDHYTIVWALAEPDSALHRDVRRVIDATAAG
ncbi:MAG TPA: alpha/beta hydrolase [Stellaceae bacterium]|nr:alpha/beta hydrolase [Stellaceae bacterium]